MVLAASPALGDEPDAGPGADAGARDDEEVAECVSSFEAAQALRDTGKLLAARARLSSCARDLCPEVVNRKCRGWLQDVAGDVPSLSLTITTSDGRPAPHARVEIDGVSIAGAADGTAIELDPGNHTVRIELDGTVLEQRVSLRRGEKNRTVRVSFAPAVVPPPPPTTTAQPWSPPPDSAPSAGLHPLTWIGLGLAGTGLVVGAVAGALTFTERADVARPCAPPECTQDDIDRVYTLAHVSTVGFVAGGVGAAVALATWIAFPPDRGRPARRATFGPLVGASTVGAAASFLLE